MKFWLDTKCVDLDPKLLSDEHRSLHAYWNGMIKNPNKWIRHSLLGPMDPNVMYYRHQEQVNTFLSRNGNHKTPITTADLVYIEMWREANGYAEMGSWNCQGKKAIEPAMYVLQSKYLENQWWE